jgi:hypothetical protein
MGICKYCGEKVGLLKSYHPECEEKNKAGLVEIKELIMEYYNKNLDISKLLPHSREIAKRSFINDIKTKELLLEGLDELVEHFFDDGLISHDEEEKYLRILNTLDLEETKVNKSEAYNKVVKGSILRELVEGKVPERVKINGDFPFILQKDEKVIFLFNNVGYSEKKNIRTYVGSSFGTSLRIAKGVYIRSSAFKGRPVDQQELVKIGYGLLCIGSKNLYFYSSAKSFKIPYNKILTLEAYSDGIGIQKDNETAKPQMFETGDGWFSYNLVQNLIESNKK